MTPAVFNFKAQYKGNTFNGTQLTFTNQSDGTPLDLTGAILLMEIKKSFSSLPTKTFTTTGGLTIISAVEGVVQIDKFLVTESPFKYLYDLQITFPNGDVNTYLTGTFEVKQNLI